jgi:DNA mismatch repair ATPase MutL
MFIKQLNKETIQLINSTQVISSVYSAIKELVENSLDAQAENIEVNLVNVFKHLSINSSISLFS